jgi:hypothetical protein
MWPWTASTQGHLYLFHFNAPLGNLSNRRAQAQHYVGFAEDLDSRIAKQLAGKGAKLVAAALSRGLVFELYHWPACLATEKLIKRRKETAVFCPACAAAKGRKPRPLPVPPPIVQLTLPLEDEPLPEIEIGRLSWAEIQADAAARRYFVKTPTEARLAAIDDLL